MAIQEIKGSEFESVVLKSDKPVLVDFNATWCGPCRMLKPALEEVAEERTDVKVVGVDIDECPELAARFRIRNVPTVLFFKGGQPVDKTVGLVAKETLTEKLNALL